MDETEAKQNNDCWQGKPTDEMEAKQILVSHLDHPSAAANCSKKKSRSWKIVIGANPAHNAFLMQHQIFYPSRSSNALWHDPVFCVETLQGDLIWCTRHCHCAPQKHWSGRTDGAWKLSTSDGGMVSEEHWTIADAADDLSWAVLHCSGAAKRAGQLCVGASLCAPDGE